MNVSLYNFAKKKNSTAIPASNTATTFSTVQLKQNTSVINPVLIFNPASTGMNPFTPSKFNYAYIPSFSRYYFVTDWRWIEGLWECALIVDPLASFKTAIGTLSEYVVRSASAYDGSVSDTMYPTTTGLYKNKELFSLAYSSSGLYVVGIINNSSNAVDGAVTYYIMTNAELGQLKHYLMDETFLNTANLSNLQEMSKDLVKAIFNPFQYIVSCRFFPLDYTATTSSCTPVTSIEIGWWSIPISTKRMLSGFYTAFDSNEITVGNHPQAATRGDYLNHAPYTERILIHPIIGTVLIDSNKITGGQKLKISTLVDFTTGAGEVYVENSTEQITLYRTSIQFAIDVQLAQIAVDKIAVAQTAISSVGDIGNSIASAAIGSAGGPKGALVGGIVGAVVGGVANGVLNHLAVSQPVMQTSGTNGNRGVYHIVAAMYSYYRALANEDLAHKGRPLCQQKTINTLSGFIMCSDAHADINCMDREREQIAAYMNGGFYYE